MEGSVRVLNSGITVIESAFFFLYGCETWYLTMREEHRLRVLGNKKLKKI